MPQDLGALQRGAGILRSGHAGSRRCDFALVRRQLGQPAPRCPPPKSERRSGGAGIYYHFDYVGDPRNYKWLNTIPITKVWEQMNLAYQYGADRIWIVNVGDLKPMEFPIEFFLHPGVESASDGRRRRSADSASCGRSANSVATYAAEIADIIAKYTKYNGRRKPELLEPATFSLENYHEAERVEAEWKRHRRRAERIYRKLARQRQRRLLRVGSLSRQGLRAGQRAVHRGRPEPALCASGPRQRQRLGRARRANSFKADADLVRRVQPHLGQRQVGPHDGPDPHRLHLLAAAAAQQHAGSEGNRIARHTGDEGGHRRFRIGVARRGRRARAASIRRLHPAAPFHRRIQHRPGSRRFLREVERSVDRAERAGGEHAKEQRLWVSIDWTKAPKGLSGGAVTLSRTGGETVTVKVTAFNPREVTPKSLDGFVEANGYVSIEAVHFTRKVDAGTVRWGRIEDLGRTLSSMAVFPFTAASVTPPANAPCLEYRMYLFDAGKVDVNAVLSPSLNFVPGRGLRYAVSFDDQPRQIINALEHNTQRDWETTVKDSVRHVVSSHTVPAPGYHTLKFWMVDPGVVLQKLVINLGGMKPSYLGPPESHTIP